MEQYLEGRYTTLHKLDSVRNNHEKPIFARRQANKAFHEILAQLRDKKLMYLRRQLMAASAASDEHCVWLYSSRIKAYEKRYNEIIECTCAGCYRGEGQ